MGSTGQFSNFILENHPLLKGVIQNNSSIKAMIFFLIFISTFILGKCKIISLFLIEV